MQRPSRGTPPNSPPANDVHPVLRRAAAPPAALDLLAQAQHGLDEAVAMETANERFAAAVRSAWEVLPEAAPELAEWSVLFASGARKRARAEAGIQGAATWREADDLVRDTGVFLRLVERMLVSQPALPPPRIAPSDEGLLAARLPRPSAEQDQRRPRAG